MEDNRQSENEKLEIEEKEINLDSLEQDENTENLVEEKNQKNNSKTRKKLIIFGIIFGVVIIGLAVILILNGQKTASIAKELELGEKYLEDGLYEEAKLAFDKVIEIDKKEVKGYEGKAEVAIVLKEYPEAEKVLEEAKVIEVTDQGKVLMAEVYINTERKEEGKTLLNDAKNNGIKNLKTVEKAAELYNQLQEYNMTIELLEEKILKTENKEALKKLYDTLIDVYIKAGKNEEEILALLERAAKATDDNSYVGRKDELIVKAPNFSLEPGEYEGKQSLEVRSESLETKIYYTIDGSEPTTTSTEYTGGIPLNPGSVSIKAIAVNKNGIKSKVVQGDYKIKEAWMSAYQPILTEYKNAEANGYYGGENSGNMPNVNENLYFPGVTKEALSYAFVDIANDGIPELIIGSGTRFFLDAYSMSDGNAVQLFDDYTMGHRSHYTLCEDGIIKNYGSSGASYGGYFIYKLSQSSSTPQLIEQYMTDNGRYYEVMGEEIKIVNGRREVVSKGTEKPMTKSEYTAAVDQYHELTNIDWKSLQSFE